MNCRMTRGIYLRANGEINCYCSSGEQVTLAQLGPREGRGFVEREYRRGRFRLIREEMGAGRLPFPDHCLKCSFLSPLESFDPSLVGREVEWLHVEPSARCNLRCPFCVHGRPGRPWLASRPGPHELSPRLYRELLEDLRRHDLALRWSYFSGRGDPGTHPGCWDLARATKEIFPGTDLLVCTNGNFPYRDAIVDSGLDKIKIALDSLDQGTYARYRVGGSVERLLELTRRIVARKRETGRATPLVVWQKVVFDFNDSPEELLAYQRAALEHGVDRVRLVLSFTKNFSNVRPTGMEWIFPDVEIKDTWHRTNVGLDELEESRRGAVAAGGVDRHVKNVNDILHWLELGMESRDAYNAYAVLPLDDPRLYAPREDDPRFEAFMGILRESYGDLAGIYARRGWGDHAGRFERYAESVPRAGGRG